MLLDHCSSAPVVSIIATLGEVIDNRSPRMEKFENHHHSRNNFFDSAAILEILVVKYERQWTLRP
jgi:hypothetical protein